MELINLIIIIVCSTITLTWALKKRNEINTMRISFIDERERLDEYEKEQLVRQQAIYKDAEDLEYVSEMFQKVTMRILDRMNRFFLIVIVIACYFIWRFFEERAEDIAQPIYFFIGAYSQIVIGRVIFKNYRIYDPRIIFLAR